MMVVLLTSGCSRPPEDKWTRARPPTFRVTGRLKVLGTSVEGAKVVFHTVSPVKGQDYSAFGYTDARGAFNLQTFRDGDGAVAGQHFVTVEKLTWEQPPPVEPGDVSPPPVETSHLPKKYRSTKTSGLTAEVTEQGPNEFVFELSTK
jgi:hypothetical protein